MKNEDIKVITRALGIMSLTLIVNIVFIHLVIFASPHGGCGEIQALDIMGHEVMFDGDNHAVNAGPVRFRLDKGHDGGDDIFLYDDMDGGILNPVEDGEYDLFPEDGTAKVSFSRKRPGSDEAELMAVYHVEFTDGIYDAPEASLTETDEGIRIEVSPLSRSHVYCSITGDKNGELEEITEKTDFLLDKDGIYRISVYGEDGMGHRSYADIPPEIVLDRTKPVISAEAAEINEDKLSMMIGASDALTGVSYVNITNGEKILYRGNGSREKAEIDISRLPYGIRKYTITAADKAGNIESDYFTLEKKDGKAPELTLRGASDKGVYGRDITVEAEAEDDSGEDCTIKQIVTRYDLSGKYLGEETYEKRSITFNTSGIYMIRAEASDEAGNTSRRSLAFAIDKKSPVIRGLLGLNGSSLKSFMINKDTELAEDDSIVQVRMMLNGMDYDGGKVSKSGKYRLQILASDEFGNISTEDAGFEIKDRK